MVTDNQKRVIRYIERNVDIKFTGSTFEDAKEFISANIDRSKRERKEYFDRLPKGKIMAPKRESWTNAFYDYRPY